METRWYKNVNLNLRQKLDFVFDTIKMIQGGEFNMKSSGQLITELRKAEGLTQEGLAERIGVSCQTIAMWEIEKRLPTDNVAILAARSLKVDEDVVGRVQLPSRGVSN
jgi:DNA-binding XRE family transcriptional regulator